MVLHLCVVGGFVGVTALLLLVTAMHRFRIQHVLLTWRTRRSAPWLLGPVLFITLVLLFLAVALLTAQDVPLTLFAGYLVGGSFWLTSALLSHTVIITEQGMIIQTGCKNQAVAWEQVIDYFACSSGRQSAYTFFYLERTGRRARFDLSVPSTCRSRFGQIVNRHLDARFSFPVEQHHGKKAMGE